MTLLPTLSYCSSCGVRQVGWRRRPCRKCGATARTFIRGLSDSMTCKDEVT